MEKKRALFMDRDGVLNRDIGYLSRWEDWEWVPGSLELCVAACKMDYLLVVITNQSGLARGYFSLETMNRLHHALKAALKDAGAPLTDLFFCPHHPDFNGRCLCRKPDSLLLERAAGVHAIDMDRSWFLGDSARDIAAGKKAGCKTARLSDIPDPQALVSLAHPLALLPFM